MESIVFRSPYYPGTWPAPDGMTGEQFTEIRRLLRDAVDPDRAIELGMIRGLPTVVEEPPAPPEDPVSPEIRREVERVARWSEDTASWFLGLPVTQVARYVGPIVSADDKAKVTEALEALRSARPLGDLDAVISARDVITAAVATTRNDPPPDPWEPQRLAHVRARVLADRSDHMDIKFLLRLADAGIAAAKDLETHAPESSAVVALLELLGGSTPLLEAAQRAQAEAAAAARQRRKIGPTGNPISDAEYDIAASAAAAALAESEMRT